MKRLSATKMSSLEVIFGLCLAVGVVRTAEAIQCFDRGVNSTEPGIVTCSAGENYCFALWNSSVNATNDDGDEPLVFEKQGCWRTLDRGCNDTECVGRPQRRKSDKQSPGKDLMFCCCSGPMCNLDVRAANASEEFWGNDMTGHFGYNDEDDDEPIIRSMTGMELLLIAAVAAGGVLFLSVMIGMAWMKIRDRKLKEANMDDADAEKKLMEPMCKEVSWEITDPLVLGDEIARGKFAAIYTGKMGGMDVALKVFTSERSEYFDNEKFIYHSLGKSSHSHIVKYHGWQKFTVDSRTSLVLAMQRIEPGNLRDFLDAAQYDTLSLADTVKIMKGIAAGLAYVHGENIAEVVIAHRDLATKNILIDADYNCYLADFGLSLLTRGSKYYWAGKEREAEFSSLVEAGTLRYMAPELLEGAVNLKDCENALKQADVYALALILWEVANLCHDVALPECKHMLPYETELGKDISIDSLSRFVVTRRDRPSFCKWRDVPASRSIRDTLVESWDPEADARLTSLCVLERLSDLQQMKLGGSDCTTPLEAPPTSPWAGRNPCLQRNLLEESSDDKSAEYVISSEKHLIPNVNSRLMFMGGSGGSTIGSSDQSYSAAATTNTDLSNASGRIGGPPTTISPTPIPFVQNIRK